MSTRPSQTFGTTGPHADEDGEADNRQLQCALILAESMRTGQPIDALPEACRPASRAAGYAIQARLGAALCDEISGWKIAATSQSGQKHIGVDGPLGGRIFKRQVHAHHEIVPTWGNRMKVAEPEFAFCFGRDIPARSASYSVDEVMAAVDSMRPAIEMPSSRFADFANAGEAQLIADNSCAGRFVFGEPAPQGWRLIDLSRHEVIARIERNGRPVVQSAGSGAAVLGDPRTALTWLVNELSRLGIGLSAGQMVSTGTCMTPLPAEPGDLVTADFGALGLVCLQYGESAA